MSFPPAGANPFVDYNELSSALYMNEVLKRENESLRNEIDKLGERTKTLSEKNETLRQDFRYVRRAVEIKSVECAELRDKAAHLEKLQSANQSSGWSLPNFLPGTKSGNTAAENTIAELETKVAGYERKIKELEAHTSQLEQQTAEQKKSMQVQTARFAQELEVIRNKTATNTPSLSDTDIQGRWSALGFSVRQFVSNHLPESLDPATIQFLAELKQFNWLPQMAKTLQVPLLCPILLESWIWHFLCFRIFDSCSKVWAGEEGKILGVLCERIRDRLAESAHARESTDLTEKFHDWRARSAHFISSLEIRKHDNPVRSVATDFLHELGPVAKAREGLTEKMYRDAQGMISKALELAEFFRLAKADFHVFITRVKPPLVAPRNFGFQFDPQTMERAKNIPDTSQGATVPTVDLAVSAGIFKAGSADGSMYHSERVLVKLQALCNLQILLGLVEGERATRARDDRH